jgi:nicotinamidase-related amidase
MPLIDRVDSLLVVIDTQPGFFRSPSMSEEERSAAAAAVDRAVWLAGIAARLEIPAVVTEEGPDRNGSTEPRLLERLPSTTPVLTKDTFGLTGTPDIMAAIRASGRSTTVLVGLETDVCVAQSAIGLRDLGFRAVVVEDATYTTSEDQHRRGLARMSEAGVEPNHCKGLVYEWLRVVEPALETLRADEARFGPPPLRL